MKKLPYTILFFAKRKPFMEDALELLRNHFEIVYAFIGNREDKFPEEALNIEADYTISYLSPWIIPKKVLINTKIAAINFHPGSPKYPGIGCTNFAIYNGEKKYGITVHYMEEKVDSGDIILVEEFDILPNDTVYTLTQRCYAYIYIAFSKILKYLLKGKKPPTSNMKWLRKPYTRKELNELCRITPDMNEEEVKRRIKACLYPNMPGAYIELYGFKFEFKGEYNENLHNSGSGSKP